MSEISDILRLASLITATLLAIPANADNLPEADANFANFAPVQVALGRLLFYDPILSGSKTVACATCHHPKMATADGVSLGLGDGAFGIGPDRRADKDNLPEQRIPRNSPALFNLGASQFRVFFHDGRLEHDASRPNGLRTPLAEDMLAGFSSALSAQAMFPVLSPDEMAGHYTENDVAQAVRQGFLTGENGAWDIISKRVEAIPAYRDQFDQVIGPQTPISFPDISNAIAAFISVEWRADNSPFDRFLRDGVPLGKDAAAGMNLFYSAGGCSGCHSGQFQTDHDFHAIAMPQIGPGKAARFESHARDTGRMRVTGDVSDAYAFRTPSLRNVTLTAPYGHSGAFGTLRGIIKHHLDPITSLRSYEIGFAVLPKLAGANDVWVLEHEDEVTAIANANELAPTKLSEVEIDQIIAFLHSLADLGSLEKGSGVPEVVPSGLKVDR